MYIPNPQTIKAYEMRKKGYMWKIIAYELGFKTPSNVRERVRYYCKYKGIKLPKPQHDRAKKAYDLKVQGYFWWEIAIKLKYVEWQHAKYAARCHARRGNLQWPVKVGVEK